MKNINFLDHPYWIPKCLNVGRISIPWQIFSYIYFPQIFTDIGWMFENVKIPIDHHAIFLFCPFQNLLILSHLSESVDVPAGCIMIKGRLSQIFDNSENHVIWSREIQFILQTFSYFTLEFSYFLFICPEVSITTSSFTSFCRIWM